MSSTTPAGAGARRRDPPLDRSVPRRSTVRPRRAPQSTPATVIAATTGTPPRGRRAAAAVATDLPRAVVIEVSTRRRSSGRAGWAGRTGAFDAVTVDVRGLAPGRRVYWRASVRRARDPARPGAQLPRVARPGSGEPVRLAIGACGAQFGPIFDDLAAADRTCSSGRATSTTRTPTGPGPVDARLRRDLARLPRQPAAERRASARPPSWRSATITTTASRTRTRRQRRAVGPGAVGRAHGRRRSYRFSAGQAEVWVLDQRRFKSDPTAPTTPPRRCWASARGAGCSTGSRRRPRRSRSSARRARSSCPSTRGTATGRRASPPSATSCSTTSTGWPGRGLRHRRHAPDRPTTTTAASRCAPARSDIPNPRDTTISIRSSPSSCAAARAWPTARTSATSPWWRRAGRASKATPGPHARPRGRCHAVPQAVRAAASDHLIPTTIESGPARCSHVGLAEARLLHPAAAVGARCSRSRPASR